MAVAFRAAGALAAANSTSSGSVGLPAGIANGDILILQVLARGTTSTVATPSGYTQAATVNITQSHRMSVFYKVVVNAGSEAAPTVTQTVSALIAARLTAWSGADTITPLDVAVVTKKGNSSVTFTASSITPVTPSSMVIWLFTTPDDNTLSSQTQGTAAYVSDTTTGNDGCLALIYELQGSTVAASGTNAMTQSVNGPDNWNSVTLALRPSSTADVAPVTALFDDILYDVDIAFGAAPLTPDPVWTRVTADLLEDPVTIEAGRQGEFAPSASGTMVGVTLANADRKYDPENTAGIYYGQLNPFTRIRIWARHSAVNYPLFTGYIKSWPQSYIGNLYSWVTLEAVDLFANLNRQTVPATPLMLAVLSDGPFAYFPFDEDPGATYGTAADLSGNGHDGTFQDLITQDSFLPGEPGQKTKTAINTSSDFLGVINLFYAGGETPDMIRTLECWIQANELSSYTPITASFQIFARSVNADFEIQVLELDSLGLGPAVAATVTDNVGGDGASIAAGITAQTPVHVVATLDTTGTIFTLYINGQPVGTGDASAGVFEGGNGTGVADVRLVADATVALGHLVIYEEALTATQILEHYLAGINGGAMQTSAERMVTLAEFAGLIDAGLYDGDDMGANTYMGQVQFQGTVLEEMQAVMVAEQGRLYVNGSGVLVAQGRAADWGTTLPVNVISQTIFGDDPLLEYRYATFELEPASSDLVRNVVAVSTGSGTVTLKDDVSIVQYGFQDDSVQANLSAVGDALNLARARLRRYSQPAARVSSMTVDLRDPDVRDFPEFGIQALLAMQLGWRITVVRRPQGTGDPIEQETTVEGITRRIGDGTFTMTVYLVPAHDAYTEHPWFIVGDPVFGLIGAAAGNKVPR